MHPVEAGKSDNLDAFTASAGRKRLSRYFCVFLFVISFSVFTGTARAQWTNEPAGSTTLADCSFNDFSKTCGGVLTTYYPGGGVVSMPGAPYSPDGVYYNRLPIGATTGDGSQLTYTGPRSMTEMYVAFYWKMNADFEGYGNGMNKLFFMRDFGNPTPGCNTGGVFMVGGQDGIDGRNWPWTIFWTTNTGGYSPGQPNSNEGNPSCSNWTGGYNCYPNATAPVLNPDTWYLIEAYVKASTCPTCRDGIIRWWVNGVLAGDVTNFNYGCGVVNEFVFDHTWDGQLAAQCRQITGNPLSRDCTREWDHYMDHLYISAPNCPNGCPVTGGAPACPPVDTVTLVLPVGFTPSVGIFNHVGPDGVYYDVPRTDLPNLVITPPAGYVGTIDLGILGINGNASTSGSYRVSWGCPPPPPPPPPPLPLPPPAGLGACDGPGPGGNTTGVTEDLSTSIATWDNVLRSSWIPTFVCMTQQLSVSMMAQMFAVGTMLDAKTQLETQRQLRQMDAEAHKDYRPSTQMCTFGTGVRSLAASEELAHTNTVGLYTTMMRRMTLSSNVSSAGGTDDDKRNRLAQFAARYCDLNDNNGQLAPICTGGSAPPARRNKDVDYTRTLENVYTLDFDMATPAGTGGATSTPATVDEEDIIALANNIYAHDTFSHISEDHVGKRYSNDKLQEMRSVNAMRSVAFNSFSHIAGMRSQGTANSTPFLKSVLVEMGLSLPEVDRLLGQRTGGTPPVATPLNLSYFAQMEILTKKMFQSPEFFTNLYDSPENVARAGVTIQAFKLMNDRDRYESSLRREMLLSLILELKLREAQTSVNNSVLRGASEMFPKR